MSQVLIVSSTADVHAAHVADKLALRGVKVFRLNTDEITESLRMAYSLSTGHTLTRSGTKGDCSEISTSDVSSVWYRKPLVTKFDLDRYKAANAFVGRECEAYLRDLCANLEHVVWVNHPELNRRADNKLAQLRLAAKLGFTVPKTMVTNDPDIMAKFLQEVLPRRTIYKTLTHPMIEVSEASFRSVYTSLVELTPEVVNAVRVTPCLFQELVEKDYELRVTVIGARVFAAKLYSQEHEASIIDWRRDQGNTNIKHELFELEPTLRYRCLKMVRELGLTFGAIDLIVTPSGETVFLEVNPNGQWLWIEALLGADISGAIIDALVKS